MDCPDLRRRRLSGAIALGAAGWLAAPVLAADDRPPLRKSVALMGTRVDVLADGEDAASMRAALDAALARMRHLADMLSRYRDDNALAALERAAGKHAVALPREFLDVLAAALRVSAASGGAFDVTVGALSAWRFDTPGFEVPPPARIERERRLVDYRMLEIDRGAGTAFLRRPGMRMDLGGIAKLPILQAGMDALVRGGATGVLINGGGDVLARGLLHGRPWRVGVRDPASPDRLLAILPLSEGVVASSGDYERCVWREGRRWHHIVDPSSGYPTTGVHGVTLVGRSVDEVNGLGAAAMVLGPEAGPAWLARDPARAALLVRADASVWASPQLASRLVPPPGEDRVRGIGSASRV